MNKKVTFVQSVSDIITNSSSEVFMVYSDQSFKQIKELVNAILAINGENKYTFDDLFEVEANMDREWFLEQYPEYDGLSDGELLEKARQYDEENYGEGYPYVNGYVVTAKNVAHDDIAAKLSSLDRIFESYVSYC
jgi:hypothetical protein